MALEDFIKREEMVPAGLNGGLWNSAISQGGGCYKKWLAQVLGLGQPKTTENL